MWATASTVLLANVLFFTSEIEISGIVYSSFRDRQNIFLKIFSTEFAVKYATETLKIS